MEWDKRISTLTSRQKQAAEQLRREKTITFRGLQRFYSSKTAARVCIDRLVLFGIAKRKDCGVWEYVEMTKGSEDLI